jgi:hypothetical protein
MNTRTYYAQEWSLLVAEIPKAELDAQFLDVHKEFAWLIAAYIAIVPYRAWTSVILWLDRKFFGKLWY